MHTDQSYWDDLIDTETSKENLDENSDAVNFSAPHMVPSSTDTVGKLAICESMSSFQELEKTAESMIDLP